MAEQMYTGGCLCGAVSVAAEGDAEWVAHCHCPSCRRATGGAFATFAGYPRDKVMIDGEAYRQHSSSPGVNRGFCKKCGASISYHNNRWPSEIHLHVGVMDKPERFEPQAHEYVKAQLQWLHLEDGLPSFDEFPTSNRNGETT
jgi:hypothetical protein